MIPELSWQGVAAIGFLSLSFVLHLIYIIGFIHSKITEENQ